MMYRVGVFLVTLALLAAVVGPFVAPFDPADQELARRLERPSLDHPFGLDELGRDVLSRILSGARVSLLVGLSVVSVSSAVGLMFGLLAGYLGGRIDQGISRVMDVLMAFPGHSAGDRARGGARAEPRQRRVRALRDWLGELRPPDAQPGAEAA